MRFGTNVALKRETFGSALSERDYNSVIPAQAGIPPREMKTAPGGAAFFGDDLA